MKRFVSILFCIVLIFALAVPSFASAQPLAGDHNNTLDALNNIDYYIYWIFQDFTEDLTSIQDWLSDIWTELAGDINFELTAMRGKLTSINDDFLPTFNGKFDTMVSHLYNSLNQLLDINEYTRYNYEFLDSISSDIDVFTKAMFGDNITIPPLSQTITTRLSSINANLMGFYNYYMDEFEPNLILAIENFNDNFLDEFDENNEGNAGYSLYMLQQVLADEEDLQFKEDNEEQKGNILNLAINGFDGVGFGFFDIFSVFSNSFDSFGHYLFDADIQHTQVIGEIFDNQDIWAWFSSQNDVAINGVQTFARNSAEPEIVTDFYNQNKNQLSDMLGVDFE